MAASTALAAKRIVILGLARQGLALARAALREGAEVAVSDAAPAEKLAPELAALAQVAEESGVPVTTLLGGHPLSLLDGCDVLFLSGGVPPQIPIVQEAVRRGIPLSNDSLLTLQRARAAGLGPLVAITGSSGKTTTTTLVGAMLQQSGRRVFVGGNIGTPLIDRLDAVAPGDPIVLELSSFQLELFDPALAFGPLDGVGPDIAAILNLTPNHLDRHPSMAAYASAKFNLLRCLPQRETGQTAGQATLVVSADDAVTSRLVPAWMTETAGQAAGREGEAAADAAALPAAWELEPLLRALSAPGGPLSASTQVALVPFSRAHTLARGAWIEGEALMYNRTVFSHRGEVRLRGAHNLSNLLAAAAISGAAGASLEAMTQVAQSFEGVHHRLEVVKQEGGVTWINDSIATSPERAVAGLRSFDPQQQTIILLAGGKDKNLPWETFAEEVLTRVSYLIGFGHAGAMIVEKVRARAAASPPSTAVVHRLDEAVELAARSARPGTVVLLSPGGTSYDAYRDFEARGQHFRELVEQYSGLSQKSDLSQKREA